MALPDDDQIGVALGGAIEPAADAALRLVSLDLSTLRFQPGPMITGALLLFGGFLLFTGTLVAAGAIMPTAKEARSIFGAMMVLLFVPFYVLSLVASDPTSPIVQIYTFFPYTAMLRNGLGSLPGWVGRRHHYRAHRPRQRGPARR